MNPPRAKAARVPTATRRLHQVVPALLFGLLFGLLSVASVPPAFGDDAPVLTQSFDSSTALPAGWRLVQFTAGNSTAEVATGVAADGAQFLQINSAKANHARVVFPVTVAPNSTYRFHALAQSIGANANAAAAVLGVDGQTTTSASVRTSDSWQPLDLYVKIGGQTTLDLTLGLGNFGQVNTGIANFDAVTVTLVPTAPADSITVDLAGAAGAPSAGSTAGGQSFAQGPNSAVWVGIGFLVLGVIIATMYLTTRSDANRRPDSDADVELTADVDADERAAELETRDAD